jgi:hypothetical protein
MKCSYNDCKKKLNKISILTNKCRCNNCYCIKHKYPETHSCIFNNYIDKELFIQTNKCIKKKIEII